MVGKSEFAFNLVRHREIVYDGSFSRIIYCLPEDSVHLHVEFIKRLKAVCDYLELVEGLPDVEELQLKVDKTRKLIIIDDLVRRAFASSAMLQVTNSPMQYIYIYI